MTKHILSKCDHCGGRPELLLGIELKDNSSATVAICCPCFIDSGYNQDEILYRNYNG